MMKVYRAMTRKPQGNWEPLNLKLYVKPGDAAWAIEQVQRTSDFFEWNDEFKIQEAEIREDMFVDAVRD